MNRKPKVGDLLVWQGSNPKNRILGIITEQTSDSKFGWSVIFDATGWTPLGYTYLATLDKFHDFYDLL